MKKLITVLGLIGFLMVSPALAFFDDNSSTTIINKTKNVTKVKNVTNNNEYVTNEYVTNNISTVQEPNVFDYGPYMDAIFWETKNAEFGTKYSYTIEDEEHRLFFGGKVYFNRMFWQK